MVVKFFPDPDLTATTTIRPSESYTRFEEAVNFGICEIIKYLVEQGIDVGQNDSLGRNAYDHCLLENDVLLNLEPVLDLLHDILSFRSFSFKRQQPIDNLEADIGDVEEEEIDV
jgi:ankyrin repeat protein